MSIRAATTARNLGSGIVLFLFFSTTALAVCPLNLKFADNPPRIVWDDVGAKTYEVQESFDNFATSRNYFVDSPPFVIRRRVSGNVAAVYTVTALLESNVLSVGAESEGCTESVKVTLKADAAFRELTRKAVVPVVGSGAGANGGRFRTSLKLTAADIGSRGRIVFHAAGSVAGPNDPAIAYAFDSIGDVKELDDVVEAMGQTGIGSLDIVPDEGASDVLPNIEVRLYDDTVAGTFGTMAPALLPYDFLQAPTMTLEVPPAGAAFRVNAGVRTLTDTRATALIYGTSGHLRDFRSLFWPAGTTTLGTISQFIGTPVGAGESVTLFFEGAAIPFFTRTENGTNDPELFIPPRDRAANVGSFVE